MNPTKMLARAAAALLFLLASAGTQAQTATQAVAPALNDAQFVSQSVPATMTPGRVYSVSVKMKNIGAATWSSGTAYRLGAQNPQDNERWGVRRAALIVPIQPGGTGTFTFQVTAPATPGTYDFQWRMVQEFVAWFGASTPNVAVTVAPAAPRNDASLVMQNVRATMAAGQRYTVSVTMKNTGTTTWTAGDGYRLGAQNPQDNALWNSGRVALGATVAPGRQYTFSFPVIAPAAGAYRMQWKMVREYVEWFGATSNAAVTVSGGAQAGPTLAVTRTPSPMIAGQPFALSWTSTNATSLTRVCSAAATGYTVNDAPATSGKIVGTASSAWVNYPSSCNWKASGPGGTAQYTETMSTLAAATGGDIVAYIHTDALGSPVARSDAAGKVISRTSYEPYGGTAGGVTPTIGFTGHMNDADTGLVYMQQRYYDPVAGRFLSIDPVTTDANTGGSFNRYVYANNSPYKYIDPDGRQAAERVVERHRKDMEAGNGAVYEPLMPYAAGATAAMLVVPIFTGMPAAAVAAGGTSSAEGIGAATATGGGAGMIVRTRQDLAVNPVPPAALPTNRPIGLSPTQNAAAQQQVGSMQAAGYKDIRVNQQQVNAAGQRCGTCRPDIQGTSPATGRREYTEYDTASSGRGAGHAARLNANDPAGSTTLIIQN